MITATVSGIGGFTNTYDDDTNPYLLFATIADLTYHAARVMADETGYTYHATIHDERGHHVSGPVYPDAVRHALGLAILPCSAWEAFDHHASALRDQLAYGGIRASSAVR